MNEFEKNGFATFIDNGDGWKRISNAKFMMKDEDGTEIEMTPNEVIKQLMQDNKSLENYINNLQSKIDKAIDKLESLLPMCIMPNNMLIHGTEKAKTIEETLDILKENK